MSALMRPRLRVPARRVNWSFVLRLARLDPVGKLAQVLFLLPFLLDELAAAVWVVALLQAELVLLDALLRARRIVRAECERRFVEQATHDLVARAAAERHPDCVARFVELDSAMAEPLLFGVVAHLRGAVADLAGFVLVAHRVTVWRDPPTRRTVANRQRRFRESIHIMTASAGQATACTHVQPVAWPHRWAFTRACGSAA